MTWSYEQRRAYGFAFRVAHEALGRPPADGEWQRYLTPSTRKKLGFTLPSDRDELEELEAVLVPCGC